MILSAKDVRATLVTQTSMNVWTKGLVHNVAETLERLEKSLSRQSVHLAQALKEKNEWVGKYNWERSAKDSLAEQVETLTKWKKCAHDLQVVYDRSVDEGNQLFIKNRALADENVKLRAELAALRPPEPKFKVGQILVVNYKRPSYANQLITVTRITPLPDEIRYWFTENNVEGFFRENCLRAQTAQEKGE